MVATTRIFSAFAICVHCSLFTWAKAFAVIQIPFQRHRPSPGEHIRRVLWGIVRGGGGDEDGRYSYVEGSSFDDKLKEIEALGGDPFFFDDGNDNEKAKEIEALGGDPFFLDDGEDSAQEDEAESDATVPDESPSSSFLSDFTSIGGVMDVIGELKTTEVEDLGGDPAFFGEEQTEDRGDLSSTPNEPSTSSFSSDPFPSHTVNDVIGDSRMLEIEELGGDPFFLMDDDEETQEEVDDGFGSPSDVPTSSFLSEVASFGGGVMDVIGNGSEERYVTDGKGPTPKGIKDFDIPVEEWDGTVDEEAHFDFD